jgi:DNA invertase Pin-like site-specific DNA recombinase
MNPGWYGLCRSRPAAAGQPFLIDGLKEPYMEGTGRAGIRRRVRIQAAVLAVVLTVDGLAAYALGAPSWIAWLYFGLAVCLAVLRIRLGRGLATPEPEPEPEPTPALAPADEPASETKAVDRAIGYVCVPRTSNGELSQQTAVVTACCEEHGFDLMSVVHDVDCAGRDRRPSLAWALEQLANRDAEILVVARLRDLSSNVANLAPLLSWFNVEQRTLIAIDLQLDTSTEAGQLAAVAITGVGSWEHERISERTRRGLEAARSRGTSQGRTAVADIPELQERIAGLREQGKTLQAIADVLNEEGVPTLRGGAMWRPSSVQRATGYRRPSAGSRGIELPKYRPPQR